MAVRKTETKTATMAKSSNSFLTEGLAKSIDFKFHAPQASNVTVAGTFNNWSQDSLRLKKGKDGNWTGQLKLKPGRYEYRFLVDNRWENDPSLPSVPNDFGSANCVLEVI